MRNQYHQVSVPHGPYIRALELYGTLSNKNMVINILILVWRFLLICSIFNDKKKDTPRRIAKIRIDLRLFLLSLFLLTIFFI